jgi:hypothetical protein
LLFLMLMGWDYVSELRPQMDYCPSPRWYMNMKSHDGIILTGKTKELRQKLVTEPLFPPQIPHRLTWVWTWASIVRGWWCNWVKVTAVPGYVHVNASNSYPRFHPALCKKLLKNSCKLQYRNYPRIRIRVLC